MDVVDELTAALSATDAEGRLLFARVDVEDFLAVALMAMPPEARPTDDDSTALLGRFAQRAGVQAGQSPDEAMAAIGRYLERHPLKKDIADAAGRVAREHLAGKGAAGAALAQFSGDKARTGVLGGGGERPAGTVPAGPLARFLVPKK